ncbi:MAG: hypothetical protein RLZZ219_482 [Cyanobacteriota bacterium]|jgi:hypothetical protein
MSALLLLLLVLTGLHHWLVEPLMVWGAALLELHLLPWVLLGALAWLLAGETSPRR